MDDLNLTDPALSNLLEFALEAALHSYSPYSGFRVGAALKLSNGEIVTGTNVENVSYGLTICAERSALVRAVTRNGPDIRIEAVAVANLNQAPSPPCGACRQFLAEFILPQAPVLFPAADGMRILSFSELFPLAFDMKPELLQKAADSTTRSAGNANVAESAVIPPLSVVQALRASAQEPEWKEYEGRIFRIGYYHPEDGLNCVWLVDDAGKYEKSVDQETIRTHFKILHVSPETDLLGTNRPAIGPR
jgi:homotetrameric cytidine deaminase